MEEAEAVPASFRDLVLASALSSVPTWHSAAEAAAHPVFELRALVTGPRDAEGLLATSTANDTDQLVLVSHCHSF
jgi:hypothetical protein